MADSTSDRTPNTEAVTFRSPKGRVLAVYGDPALLTMDRMGEFGVRADSDPRIATLSLTPGEQITDTWLRATAPAGVLIAISQDHADLVGPLPDVTNDDNALLDWARRASERGLWHDWWLTTDRDVARAMPIAAPAAMDEREADDPSSSHFPVHHTQPRKATGLSIAVDVTWLGPYETGAQVLTTAAVRAMADDARVARITLVGLPELPAYAQHLVNHPKVHVATPEEQGQGLEPSDVVWYPNQIDGRSNIAAARELGRRVVTTYLDLIAYDIPRYHASDDAWAAYRAMQRRIALSVDGVTTISADVAARLMQEVPRLEPHRVRPITLGLDHITGASAPDQPDADLADVLAALTTPTGERKRFIAVLGNDFQHKNRDLAIAAWQHVLQQGTPCDLVLAGLHVRSSSSRAQEDALLATHVDLRGTVHTVGHVSGASRAWLLKNAAVVLYPSSAEGFGFVPYEAAQLGTPSSFIGFGPLTEVSGVTTVPTRWTIDAIAQDVTALLTDPSAAEQRLADLHRAIATHTWQRFAEHLLDFFQHVIGEPTVLTSTLTGSTASDAMLASILQSRTWRATERLRRVRGRFRR
jgi:glycosyltransferase involved in cell wall biosynthesis